jgi:non-specific serine/threonine protein kinase
VSISIGETRQSRFNADSMLDFRVNLAVEGDALTEQEREKILAAGDGLVFIKGRWAEVDSDKLAKALEHWKKVEHKVGDDGVSFIEGMRLLAGAPQEPDSDDPLEADRAAWSEMRAGEWLEERLAQLRQPQAMQAALPGKDLNATLRPYQETGVRWLWFLSHLGLGACLADDMGLGKTIQVIALLLLMKKRRNNRKSAPALLVLPASLLANWKSEIERFAPTLVVRFAHPSQTTAEDLKMAADDPNSLLANADVVLTTYGMVLRQQWMSSVEWSLVVLDEAQAIKNPAARQTRAIKQLDGRARIVLTGTPI